MPCTEKFPSHLIDLIKVSKYFHLATASVDSIPSVSLMNYIYVPAAKTYDEENNKKDDYIIFATFANTEKYSNILSNPTVSLLFHDWVTANNLSIRKTSISASNSPNPEGLNITPALDSTSGHPSKLLNLLQQLNQAELNEMSATTKGCAIPLDPNSNESKYYKDLLLKANPDAEVFILGENTVVVKVKIEGAQVTDSENNISVYN